VAEEAERELDRLWPARPYSHIQRKGTDDA
jgi:hypothetical protein